MKKCKSCKVEIANDASKCSHCGTDQRGWFMRHKILTGILGLVVLFIIIGALGSSNKGNTNSGTNNQTSTDNNQAQSQQAPAKPQIITASSLIGEFDKNKLAANDKYKGQLVQTSAYIENISQDVTGNYYLSLKPTNDQYYMGTTIACYSSDKSQFTSLSNGQQVTVQGAMGEMSLGIVVINDCKVMK